MTLEFTPKPGKPLALPELVQLLKTSNMVDNVSCGHYQREEIEMASQWLVDFAANKQEILDIICNQLVFPNQFQSGNDVQPPTFILYSERRFAIRMVLWLPPGPQSAPAPFSWLEPHDHNFDFLTTNFFGDGYTTRLYEYDYNSVDGAEGEEVAMNYFGEQMLSPGKVIFFFRSKDMHIQFPPPNLSVSINIIIQPRGNGQRQYEFDLDRENNSGFQVARIKNGRFERFRAHKALFAVLMKEGNERSRELLHTIASSHTREELRSIAFVSMLSFATDTQYRDQVYHLAMNDPSNYVRVQAQQCMLALA
ncbi:hypothetical protein [Photorhabdus luminescens]|uniref:Uncharacterized protein n=1 Tax=Photorhabdus luminescens subsp. sonorensis TaxID=1173677 RepID=A0A5C4RF31_PHOLU|nr:hypothetical protein [Photorhabdus luminescens]TNH42454.1 hypothetical protein EP164_16785 [Photorhabdus luminescens subsp. sonorensis]